jgi:hypothetical protein
LLLVHSPKRRPVNERYGDFSPVDRTDPPKIHRMKRKFAVGLQIVVGLVALLVGWGFYRNYRIASRYEAVSVGAAKEQVEHLLGTPSWVEPCGKSFGTPKPNCTEYIYRNSFAPLAPEYYSVSFDTSGHVLDKYVYSSP